jgi:hypothetical protein
MVVHTPQELPLSPPPADFARLTLPRWIALCAIAEAIGMTAAATAAKVSQATVGEPETSGQVALSLSLVVAGGLVEGVALGGLQAVGLGRALPRLRKSRWLLVTTAVAGLGWAAASAPAALSGADDGGAPPLLLVVAGASMLGGLMGALLGAAQASVLRGHVRHPWRWVGASAAAWVPAMAVIFLGASLPGADWAGTTVAALGTLTGLLAGAAFGVVSGWCLPALDGPPTHNRTVLWVLRSRVHRALDGSLVALRVRGAVTGRSFDLPVQYSIDDEGMVIFPARPESKRWWRNLSEPSTVDVLLHGTWRTGYGALLQVSDNGYDAALASYRTRWPRVRIPAGSPLVLIRLSSDSSLSFLNHSDPPAVVIRDPEPPQVSRP